jgi:hypothetical protein
MQFGYQWQSHLSAIGMRQAQLSFNQTALGGSAIDAWGGQTVG